MTALDPDVPPAGAASARRKPASGAGALRRNRLQLALALDAAGFAAIWEWDTAADLVRGNGPFADLFGLGRPTVEEGLPLAAFLSRVDADHQGRAGREFAAALTSGELSTELKAGGRWLLVKGRARRRRSGRRPRLSGVALDVTDRHEVAEALRDSEARFRAIADSMPQMVWSTRPDGFHDYYNARWYEFTGIPEGSTDGEGWSGMFHPDDRECAWARWRHSLATGEPYEVEYRLRDRHGAYRWTLGRALPVRDREGRITRWFGTCTDIDGQKRAAEQNEILTHELSHRIKNIFAVIAGLIGLSARHHPEAKPYARDLGERIAALGRAHDFARPHSEYSRPESGETTLHSLLRELFRPYPAMDEGRLVIGGEDVPVDDKGATPIALVFHELATNAAKYGALSSPEGRIAIETRRAGEAITLSWRERGGPPAPGPPPTVGFGTRLADLSVQAQLGGAIERRWPPEGLEVAVEVPERNLRRQP